MFSFTPSHDVWGVAADITCNGDEDRVPAFYQESRIGVWELESGVIVSLPNTNLLSYGWS